MSKYYNKVKRKRKKADSLWRKACFSKHGKLCEVCGKPAEDPHHFIPKSLSARLRLDLKNCVPLCRSCHFAHHNKGDPEITAKIVAKRGEEWHDYIKKHRRETVKKNLGYYDEHIKVLKSNLGD